ncbi:hypothetical protein [Streptomyces sp. NBC_01217]|uniref:hypothetical protein n=1 Tax=Streptomyces sp. NBC_01217 TaxID=2903779 RepID=UPI002E11BD70|nr:hypothetical protein OG507_18365 [Streptomyces sp. NBC_01217]
MFDVLWVCGLSALALPLAIALICGWSPRWVRRRTSPWGIRVRGVAFLVLWASGMVVPLAKWGGLDSEDAALATFPAQFGMMTFAAGLMCGSELGEWFYRRAVQSTIRDGAGTDGGWPQGPHSSS